jgi:uridine phosphorylase
MQVNGKHIAIITGAVFGGPQAAIYVEEMKYLGVNAVIGVMIAAGVNAKFELEEFFYVDQVVCLDGVSTTYYERNEIISTSFCHKEILSIASDLDIELKPAKAASVDAIYHETPEIINHLKELGVDVTNLDIAPFVTTSKLRGVDAIMFGYVSDRFEADRWASWQWDRDTANKTSADILSRLIDVIT